jgi:hydrogenase maturation protease
MPKRTIGWEVNVGVRGSPPVPGRRVAVLVCGEPERGDDAVASAALSALPGAVRSMADVVLCGQLEVEHLLDVPEGVPCIVVDAAVGVPPGEVVAIPLEMVAARPTAGAPRSSHTLPPDQVISLAAALRGRPPEGIFVGIGGEEFGLGAGLSTAVLAGLPRLVERLAAEIERLSRTAAGSDPPDA